MKYVPDPWTFTILALAAWRVWLLFADDKILEKPMDALYRKLKPQERRVYWREFVECPRCLGFWVSVTWWAAWLAWPTWTTRAAVPWAIAAVVALVESVHKAIETQQED